jgi:hypothetical protein
MAIETRKIAGREIDWDSELGGPVIYVPDEAQPVQPLQPPPVLTDGEVGDGVEIRPVPDQNIPKGKAAKPKNVND